jgi:autotransporter-associated beta strand protein
VNAGRFGFTSYGVQRYNRPMKTFASLPAVLLAFSGFLPICALAGSATWNLNPTSTDWFTANNWTPVTVPNGSSDVATFATSSQTAVSLSFSRDLVLQLSAIQFAVGASPFAIALSRWPTTVEINGIGIVNESGIEQNILLAENASLAFHESAVVGDLITITNQRTTSDNGPDSARFYDQSSAGNATIVNQGCTASGTWEGVTEFWDNSTAANATIVNEGASAWLSGYTLFEGDSTAGNAIITNAGMANGASAPFILFESLSTADHATITNSQHGSVIFAGASTAGFSSIISTAISNAESRVDFTLGARGGRATITAVGGINSGEQGAHIYFREYSQAEDSVLIAKGGTNGGSGAAIFFLDESTGDRARVELSDNAELDITDHAVPGLGIGSLEGKGGSVILGNNHLTMGSNNLSTIFRGIISGTGSISKIGRGDLVLGNANSYTGGTVIAEGRLALQNVDGSATGSGPVIVRRGTLSGRGRIAGKVTVGIGSGTGALIDPGGRGNGVLSIAKSLTLNPDATYNWELNSNRVTATSTVAHGLSISGAQFSYFDLGDHTIAAGTVFMVINNTGPTAIAGAFNNLLDGATVSVGSNTFQANYEGGDGNDLTLTVVQ